MVRRLPIVAGKRLSGPCFVRHMRSCYYQRLHVLDVSDRCIQINSDDVEPPYLLAIISGLETEAKELQEALEGLFHLGSLVAGRHSTD
jgi:hypothetical protein